MPDACELIRQNRAKFHAENLHPHRGPRPGCAGKLPAPDAVFIGGSKGSMAAMLDAALADNPLHGSAFRAIALETLGRCHCRTDGPRPDRSR